MRSPTSTGSKSQYHAPMMTLRFLLVPCVALAASLGFQVPSDVDAKPDLFKPLTEPPCSYCSNQNRKGLVEAKDPVLAWLRGPHNGGCFPLRFFIAGPRVINDTYGLFFYDADGGYVAAYKKDYGYSFYGWRRGVMVVKSKDGSLWSALSGECFDGPAKGQKLERVPSMLSQWAYWMMLHPESTAYDLYDGKKYPVSELPTELSLEAKRGMGEVDPRLAPLAQVVGVAVGGETRSYPLDGVPERASYNDAIAGKPIAVFCYGVTKTASAWSRELEGQTLTFYADAISPETAPFKDKETGTRWSLAGRGIDGPLRGKELTWVDSIQCRWYAWSAEHPKTSVHEAAK